MVRLLLLLFFVSCQPQPKVSIFHGTAMTIDYRILIGNKVSSRKTVEKLISTTFQEIDAIYNKWNPNSELSQLNGQEAHTPKEISPKLEAFLKKTGEIVALSEGRFDPTIEPLQRLWKRGFIPPEEEIEALIPAIGWDKIHFSNGTFVKDHSLTELDLGGIAKGYCVDLLVERLNEQGFPNVYVEWGGEIRASGSHPDHRPWTIFISRLGDPDPEKAIAILELQDEAVATSGDYLQNWSVEGKTYQHIIDPKTLKPLEIRNKSLASASVLAPSCTIADGLATTLMLFPNIEEAKAFAETLPDCTFWLLDRP